ncbi:MAG: VanZ family protein [Pseudomonadota bacterium]
MLRWLPALLYGAGVFVASSLPGDYLPSVASDKVVHLVVFTGLGVLVCLGFGRFWLAVATTALYGVADELHQRFTPGRESCVLDAAADVGGAVLGAALLFFFLRWRTRSRIHADHS